MTSIRVGALAAMLILVSGCGAYRSFRLPMAATQAHNTFAPLAACAGERTFNVAEHPDSLNVQVEEPVWVQYMVQNNQYNMVILVDDKAVPPAELDAKFKEAKATGDELWECAKAHMNGGPAAAPVVAPVADEPAPAPAASMGFDTKCAKLAACFAAIVDSLCKEAENAQCEASFKVEGNPDEEMCQDMLNNVPELLTPYKMVLPGYQTPAACL